MPCTTPPKTFAKELENMKKRQDEWLWDFGFIRLRDVFNLGI